MFINKVAVAVVFNGIVDVWVFNGYGGCFVSLNKSFCMVMEIVLYGYGKRFQNNKTF